MNISLVGKHALVCGSTRGIGSATAEALAELGATVTLLARNEEALKSRMLALPVNAGQSHSYVTADFHDTSAVRNAAMVVLDRGLPVHILVNNTGGPRPGAALASSPGDFENAFHHHLSCNHILASAFSETMKSEGFGRIINIISTSVREPIRGLGVSNTIRAAVAGWAKTISVELAPFGITVNNVLPGATKTDRMQEINERKAKDAGVAIEEIERGALAEIPAGRFAEPNEIANAVAFLASPAAAYITGVSLAVDGGRMRSI